MELNCNNVDLSIIIPVHNSEKFILSALNSIFPYVFDFSFEVIIIDDNSTDNSLSIVKEFAKEHSNIVLVLLNECKGVSNARNIGIDSSRGDFITFLDSDDEIIPQCLNEAFHDMQRNNYDMLQFNYSEKNNKHTKNCILSTDNIILKDSNQMIKSFLWLEQCNINNSVWNKIFKRSSISSIRFDTNIAIGEDQKFVFEVITSCSSIKLINEIGYIYYIRNSSAMRTMDFEKSYQRVLIFDYIQGKVENKEIKDKCELDKLYLLYSIYCDCLSIDDSKHADQIYNEFKLNKAKIENLFILKKLIIIMLKKHRNLFDFMYKILKRIKK